MSVSLTREQHRASDPGQDVWLSASAGTGKTSVLAARLLRLLMRGVRPDTILALTFTKAGAAEMAERVHRDLTRWVRMSDAELARVLKDLGEDFGPEQVGFARTLFARVLEARGGGLRIMTIHAFCQTLLGGFPLEAGLTPGFRPIEPREEAILARSVLAELVVSGEGVGDPLIGQLRALSLRLGEEGARGFLLRAGRSLEALEGLGPGLAAKIRGAMGVPLDFDPASIEAACVDDVAPIASFYALSAMLDAWGGARGAERGEVLGEWLLADASERVDMLGTLRRCWCKADGIAFAGNGWVPVDPGYEALVARLDEWCGALIDTLERARLADDIAGALEAGRRFGRAYADAKRVRGLVDFDDLIREARSLLMRDGIGDWIRYKLDQATDHILVDEAQDTNTAQWSIVAALAGEFYAGDGAKSDRDRTIFTVGDYKQAIFSFQGTDPVHYHAARQAFGGRAEAAGRVLLRLSLDRSFRSVPPVLAVVDAVLATLGEDALGLGESEAFGAHVSAVGGAGGIMMLAPLRPRGDEAEGDAGEEEWIDDATRRLAGKIARQVKAWIDMPLAVGGDKRALTAGDVMILVRKRGALAALLVARLHAEGVPVAGVDRLRLQAPLAVKDLMAALRFAAQPGDDLNLANLLVSPLVGWDQEALFAVAYARSGRLWDAVRAKGDAATVEALLRLLNAADRVTPFAFLEEMLSGALQGRAKLIARLGEEVRDAIDELLNAAIQYEREGTAALQGFVAWFDSGETEIVRDAGGAGDAVRVMTVHGAKGLQAPLVILADACVDPANEQDRDFKFAIDEIVGELPLFSPRKAERALVASLEQAAERRRAASRQEHWRLLYVAMTRAQERLVIAGSLGVRAKDGAPAESWYAKVAAAMATLGVEAEADAEWGAVWRFGHGEERATRTATVESPKIDLPSWLRRPAPVEARPARPLAPSSLGTDDVAQPPVRGDMAAAAERGRLLHALFERLPAVASERRRAAGEAWLAARVADAAARAALIDGALRVIEAPEHAAIFAADALTEAPIAGVVDGVVVAGTVDRLVVGDDAVEVVDFKTGRRAPQSVGEIPTHHLRQMAAYVAVVRGIFPGRRVGGTLLYTEGPVVHRLTEDVLERNKPGLGGEEEVLAAGG